MAGKCQAARFKSVLEELSELVSANHKLEHGIVTLVFPDNSVLDFTEPMFEDPGEQAKEETT